MFEAYVNDSEEEADYPDAGTEEGLEEHQDDIDGEEVRTEDEEGKELVEMVDEPGAVDSPPLPVEEPVTPFADPPTGLFDRSDIDAWDWLHRTFAAVVTKLDAELGGLFDELRARGLDQSAAWVVTSDFGYPLGEHGQVGLHRPWLHEELVHLPLFLRLPGAEQAGRRVSGFTQPPDLFPTLLALTRRAARRRTRLQPAPAGPRGRGVGPRVRCHRARPRRRV